MASPDDDINTGAVTGRLRALSAEAQLSVLVVDEDEPERELISDRLAHDHPTEDVRELQLTARLHAGMHACDLRTRLRETRAVLPLAVRAREGH
jgi:hypothetical protein